MGSSPSSEVEAWEEIPRYRELRRVRTIVNILTPSFHRQHQSCYIKNLVPLR